MDNTYQMSPTSNYFICCCDKIPGKNTLRKDGLIELMNWGDTVLMNWGDTVHYDGRAQWRETGVAGYKQRAECLLPPSPLMQGRNLAGNGATCIQGGCVG